MGMLLFLFLMAICVGMVVYGVVTFTVRFRRQRRRRALASTRLNPADIEVMANTAPEPVQRPVPQPVTTEHGTRFYPLPEEDLLTLLAEQTDEPAPTSATSGEPQ